jgi:deoxyadenosine/deoxycytidine kinase
MASFGANNDWFIIEGTIGAGKSTMCKMLGEALKDVAEVIQEPVDKWRTTIDDETGKNILENFYEDQQRWSYSFQTFTFLTRMEDMMTKPQQKPFRLVERSIYTDKLVFAKSLADMGKMSRLEWNMYNDWWNWLSKECFDKISHPRGFIYLRTEAETAFNRMLKRERSEEKCVPLDYLKMNVKYHDDWLLSPEFKDRVLVIDVNAEFETDPVEFARIKQLISTFMVDCQTVNKKQIKKNVDLASIEKEDGPKFPSFPIPDDLCDLLQIPREVSMNRFQVEERTLKYVMDNSLRNKHTNMVDISDEKFRKVFSLPEGVDKIRYDEFYMHLIAYYVKEIELPRVLTGPYTDEISYVSDELCDFMKVAHGTPISVRSAVMAVAQYTFNNWLQEWDCVKNSFVPDEKLRNLFSIKENGKKRSDPITYDELETHVIKHFPGLFQMTQTA